MFKGKKWAILWPCWSSLGNFTIALNCQMYWRVQRIRLSDGGLNWGLGLWGWLGGGEEQIKLDNLGICFFPPKNFVS